MELFQPQTRSVLFNFPQLNFLPGERDPGLLFKNHGAELLAIPLLDDKVETTLSPTGADLGFFFSLCSVSVAAADGGLR